MRSPRDHTVWPAALEYLQSRNGEACHATTVAEAIGRDPKKVSHILAHHGNLDRDPTGLIERVAGGTYRATGRRQPSRSAPTKRSASNGRVPKSDIDYITQLDANRMLIVLTDGSEHISRRITA